LDFLLLFLPVDAAGAAVSAAAVFEALSAAAFLLFCDFFVVAAVVSLAAALSAAAADLSAAAAALSAAAAFSLAFLAFFLAFLAAAVSELVSLALACAFAKAGEMATVSIRQEASIHRVSLFWKRFIFPREIKSHQAPFLRINTFDSPEKTKAMLERPSMITPGGAGVNQNYEGPPAGSPGKYR
jgi:hypothetical protein